jgi:hypothetical protein
VRRTAVWYRRHHEDPATTRDLVEDDLTAFVSGSKRAWAKRSGRVAG